jgi:hypothetical protein
LDQPTKQPKGLSAGQTLALSWVIYIGLLISGAIQGTNLVTDEDFYDIAAQVIPVLLLAGAVEIGAFRTPSSVSQVTRLTRTSVLTWAIAGETMALAVVGGAADSDLTALATIWGLIVSAMIVLINAVRPLQGTGDKDGGDDDEDDED